MTKEDICNAALELFLEKGYDRVSLREIAAAAGTTIGNLTHYFPQKDALLAMLQEHVQNQFPMDDTFPQEPVQLLEQLISSFFLMQKNELENPYYYENMCEFYKDSNRVRENIVSFRKKLFSHYYIKIITLRDLGVFKSEYPSKAYINLAYLCVFLGTFWTVNSSPYHDRNFPKIPVTESLYHLFQPYVTSEYLEIFHCIYNAQK